MITSLVEYFYNNYWTQVQVDSTKYSICGWAEYKKVILKGEHFVNILEERKLNTLNRIRSFVSELNGNFTIIISNATSTYILSDRMRMFPVLYFIYNDSVVLTDNLTKLIKEQKYEFQFNESTLEQYFFSDYVFGYYTIIQNVFSTQSGELIFINYLKSDITRKQYFKWEPLMLHDTQLRNLSREAEIQDEVFYSVFTRMIQSAPEVNNWIVPLSGGYDSRTIVNYLFKLGIKNVVCFSYGMESNIQSEISEKVADTLGYKWYFVDYKEWINKIKKTNLIDDYLINVFNGTSVAHLQDFVAVFALTEMRVLHDGDIFVPGHALEVLAGNHLEDKMLLCNDNKSSLSILHKHFSGFGYADSKRTKVSQHVENLVGNYNIDSKQIPEYFDWQERQTKFIAYSVKVYEFFGYEWRIPEWDNQLFSYWKYIGFNYRLNRNMYKKIFKDYLCVEQLKDIPYANDILEKNKKLVSKRLIDYMPFEFKRLLKKYFFPQSHYYTNEGLHLVHTNQNETIKEYIKSFNVPYSIKNQLKHYPLRQKLFTLPVNSVSTLLNIRFISTAISKL